jgi:two-component system, cell cycle sensor histidine kinase and response regulator CckA
MTDVSAQATARSPKLQVDLRTQVLEQKTNLVGELAGAVANQFNNIMMAVTSYAELELKKAPPTNRKSLEQLLSNAGRAASLMQKLLAFSRTRTPSQQVLRINCVVTDAAELLQQLVGEGIEIVLGLEPELPEIKSDPAELEELLMALAIQARNAMPSGGKISLSTKAVDLNQEGAGANQIIVPGKYVLLSVCDSGKDPAVPRRGPQPGVNTQDLRTNLVAAAADRIVKEAQGFMRIASDPEQGTTIAMYFPARERRESERGENIAKRLTTSKTILVVEDDDSVRVPAAEFLKMEGFKVLQAKTGQEAINVALQKHSQLDLLVTDIVMPTMSGRQVAKELVEMNPDLKVLYMSGDAGEAAHTDGSQDDVLQKPFRLDKLNEKIRNLLGR